MNRASKFPDYVLIGHVTHDLLDDGTTTIGGTASYAAFTAQVLGMSVGILTSAGTDFQIESLARISDIIVNPSPVTTTFKNTYINGARSQRILGIASKLQSGDMPESWSRPLIAHIAPVFDECDPGLIDHFHNTTYIGVTLQGWLREKLPDDRVVPVLKKNGLGILRNVSAVIVSEDDICSDWTYAEKLARSTRVLVVTCGSRGGYIYKHNKRLSFSAPQVQEVNPTGAGDIFAAAFFFAAARGYSAYAASSFASCLASRSVIRTGLASIPTQTEVCHCMLITPKV